VIGASSLPLVPTWFGVLGYIVDDTENGYNCSMSTPILTTKLYIPPPRPNAILRPRLIERLHEGLHRKLTLISAPAGFGKTTLVSAWIASCGRPVAWLSLDEGTVTRHAF
jgi:LuxR family transcriptional regulator, maltose regulon positive regulatory protein